jgi:hypothetical protein
MVHTNATVLPNSTIKSTTASHAGQMFFDQFLLDYEDYLHPYDKNQQPKITNEQDTYFKKVVKEGVNPILGYTYLDKRDRNIMMGIFAWTTVGIDPGAVRQVHAGGEYKGL